jgi:DNA repair exonuclease SbcCD ATPase subunit
MRIQQLELTNFGSHRTSRFTFDAPITLIYSLNNGGKSTVCDAIEYLLTGKTRGTDARGAGVDALIYEGADRMKVSATVEAADGVATVVRGVTGRTTAFQLNGEGGTLAERQAAFYALVGGHEGVLTALTRSRAFLDLKHADAKDLLLQVLNVRVDVDGERLTLVQLDARYEQAFEARREAKARAAAIRVPDPPTDAAPDVDALEAQLRELRGVEHAKLASTAKADGERGALEAEHARVVEDLMRVKTSLEVLPDMTAKIAELGAQLDTLEPAEGQETALQKHRTALAAADGRLPMLERTLTQIQEHDPKKGCVLDAAIPCKTATSHFAGQVSKLEQQVMTLKAEKDSATEALAAQKKLSGDRENLERQLRDLHYRHTSRTQLVERATELTATRDRLHDEIAALPPAAGPDPDLEALQARIARGEQTIRDARAVADACARHREATTQAAAAAKHVAELEAKVDRLGPKGERVQALAASLAVFEGAINGSLAKFGYSLHFEVDPWQVTVNGRSVTRLSESERLRVGVSLQIAIAEVTGIGFVVIDGADLLDATNRGLLVSLLSVFDGQAIVTATRDQAPGPIDGVAVYWLTLERGVTRVDRIGSPVAA